MRKVLEYSVVRLTRGPSHRRYVNVDMVARLSPLPAPGMSRADTAEPAAIYRPHRVGVRRRSGKQLAISSLSL
jgi:hypothetical protein